jgi:hypothetical protein
MYKSDYYTKDQMTKYKMKADINKTWLHTLQFFTKLFAQRKAYRDARAANSGLNSEAHINDIPSNRSLNPPPVISPPMTSTLRSLKNQVQQRGSMSQRNAPLSWTNQTQQIYYA